MYNLMGTTSRLLKPRLLVVMNTFPILGYLPGVAGGSGACLLLHITQKKSLTEILEG